MANKRTYGLCGQVIHITHAYLGPAAERFVLRQIEHHLHKRPEDLSRKDLHKLIVWIDLAMNLLEDDKILVEEYIAKLQVLANERAD